MIPARRFWKKTAPAERAGGFGITLDDKPLRSKNGAEIILPSRALAEAIRAEWESVGDKIDPDAMPMFAFAVTALDRIAPDPERVIAEITAYGASDLLCYRADTKSNPATAGLRQRQDATWQPYLDSLAADHGIRLAVFEGVMPRAQSAESLAGLKKIVQGFDAFALAGLHALTTTTGSLVLGLATATGRAGAEEAHRAALVDESWQQEKWGVDDEAALRQKNSLAAMIAAKRYLDLLAEGSAGRE